MKYFCSRQKPVGRIQLFSLYAVSYVLFTFCFAIVPLPNTPSWTSIDNDFSTGGGFADINNDGFIDFCTSNGNDMALNKQAIYLNNNGVLETQASWRSADSGMFGHLYLGDIDNDGHLDMSVSYLGIGSNQGKTRIYRNSGTALEPIPYWLSQDQYNSFDVCFGDIDLDGDLDLAVATGDAYSNINTPARIYKNNNGVLEPTGYWSSLDSTPSNAIRFADLNHDGYLDLIVGGLRKLWVYYNQNGAFPQTADWVISERGWILRIATADYDNDGWIDLAIAVNGQLSGDSSRIKVFKNNQGQLNTSASFTMLRNRRYCSCVAWADVNNDGFLDLSAGGWWEPMNVFENRSGILDTIPTWSWVTSNLVCEALIWGDVRNYHIVTKSDTFIGNSLRKLFYTKKSPLQKLVNITVQNNIIPVNNYCYDLLTGWVILNNAPAIGETIILTYRYSSHPDLAVTNWTASAGNYLFYNTTPQAIVEDQSVAKSKTSLLDVSPNPFNSQTAIRFSLSAQTKATLEIYDVTGRLIKTFSPHSSLLTPHHSFIWDGKDDFNNKISKGIYFAQVVIDNKPIIKKIIKL